MQDKAHRCCIGSCELACARRHALGTTVAFSSWRTPSGTHGDIRTTIWGCTPPSAILMHWGIIRWGFMTPSITQLAWVQRSRTMWWTMRCAPRGTCLQATTTSLHLRCPGWGFRSITTSGARRRTTRHYAPRAPTDSCRRSTPTQTGSRTQPTCSSAKGFWQPTHMAPTAGFFQRAAGCGHIMDAAATSSKIAPTRPLAT
mmetsp:Transcript_36282/g.53246  ORF Transcript_36282/g.53246 Transcript_36282/m.53246 type:complete len:200 (+) Transcript_36282:715-1314(+)